MKELERIDWVDQTRGYAIILVVLGHILTRVGSIEFEKIIQLEIYSFHMPLFFFLSGFIYKNEGIFHKIKKIIIPMFIFYIVYFLFLLMQIMMGDEQINISTKLLFNTIFITSDSLFSVYWFLPVLFCTQILYDNIIKSVKRISYDVCGKQEASGVIMLIAVAILIGISRVLYKYNISLPWGLREAMLSFCFFWLGIEARNRKYMSNFIDKITRRGRFRFLIALTIKLLQIVVVAICFFCLGYELCGVYNSDIGNWYTFILFGIIGIYSSIFLCSKLTSNILKILGMESIWIYGFHYLFLDAYCVLLNHIALMNVTFKIIGEILGIVILIFLSLVLRWFLKKLLEL